MIYLSCKTITATAYGKNSEGDTMTHKLDPTVTQLSLFDGGMSYAVRLTDGSFIMIDGGMAGSDYEYNANALTEFFADECGNEKPVIAAWMITHFHLDHVDMAARYLSEHTNELDIKAFIYNHHGNPTDSETIIRINAWDRAMSLFPNAEKKIITTGETIRFPGVDVKILLTEQDRFPITPSDTTPNPNRISSAMRFIFDTGHTFTVLGDCDEARIVSVINPENSYYQSPESLTTDVLQVAHHGFPVCGKQDIDALRDLYQTMHPRYALFSANEYDYLNDKRYSSDFYSCNRYLLEAEDITCLHHGTTHTINMRTLELIR